MTGHYMYSALCDEEITVDVSGVGELYDLDARPTINGLEDAIGSFRTIRPPVVIASLSSRIANQISMTE